MARVYVAVRVVLMSFDPVVLFVFLGTLLAVAFGWYARTWTLRHRPSHERRSEKRCDVCFEALPKGTIRTSAGRWRCAAHKGAA